ncbi:MAG: PhoP regulatory network YrbL family protein [Proteobacteria bacterium]|nr:PhoP regulatory network YrbL family protein [Pseudomonadota bacterium]MBU1714467.1 PhoP regulatory network YrbL family protein [Pseudomonadota bacterium]
MIKLNNSNLVGTGNDRVVYQDPTHPDRCIKISRHPVDKSYQIKGLQNRLLWLARGRDLRYFDHNFVDVLTAELLEKRNNQRVFDHLPRCFGFVDTDLGPGVSWETIRNSDNSPCISLKDCYHQPGILGENETELLKIALNEFFAWQLDNHIMLREIAFTNTLVRRNEDGSIRLYHIDAIGCVDIIPLALYFNGIAGLRIRSKIFRFKKKLPWFK